MNEPNFITTYQTIVEHFKLELFSSLFKPQIKIRSKATNLALQSFYLVPAAYPGARAVNMTCRLKLLWQATSGI